MARVIHHAITKKAAKNGVAVILDAEDAFRIQKGPRLSVESFDGAKEALDEYLAGHVTFDKATGNFCGVMVASYHDRYEHNAHGPGSCDGLDMALRDEFTKPTGIEVERLEELGRELGLWADKWNSLNPGMKRMNLSNRIRAWLRNDKDALVRIGQEVGRFGVAYRPAKRNRKAA